MEPDDKEEVECREWKTDIAKSGLRDMSPPEGIKKKKLYDLAVYYCKIYSELPKWLTDRNDRIEVAVRYMLATGGLVGGRIPQNMIPPAGKRRQKTGGRILERMRPPGDSVQ